jgi:hypothetical protein
MDLAAPAAYALGALLLAGEGAVHVQQFVSQFHGVRWIGPIVISAVALASLIISYGTGLFGWQEGGFRTPVALAMITEALAVILLATALTLELSARTARASG